MAEQVRAGQILVLAISMVGRGLAFAGADVAAPFSGGNVLQAQLVDGVQVAEFDLSFDSYANVSVRKGVPARLVINVDANTLTGCNNEIVIGEWGLTETDDAFSVPAAILDAYAPYFEQWQGPTK